MTITEALAEITTIGKRIAKKQEFIINHLGRISMVRDPLEKDGGATAVVSKSLY